MERTKLDDIVEMFPEEDILKADGYDYCILGFDYSWDGTIRLIYSVNSILNVLINENDMDEDEAIEYFEFNIRGAYVGEKTPIWCQDDF
jgi:hypothetical protein